MRICKLAPSILSADYAHLGRDILEAASAGVEYIHFDVMDGHFVPNISIGIPVLQSVRKFTPLILDVHLMIENPGRYVEAFAFAGADIITVHYEASEELGLLIDKIASLGKKPAVSIRPATPPEVLFPYIEKLHMVLVMSVEPGFGGQKYMPVANGKIAALRSFIDSGGYGCLIEVDGGIYAENAAGPIAAGADILVSGSGVFGQGGIGRAVSAFDRVFKAFNS